MTATLTAADVATDLHLSRSTTVDYLRSGRIPGGFQPVAGGRWLVDAATYRQWREDRRADVDPHRIEPRTARSKAAQNRRTA